MSKNEPIDGVRRRIAGKWQVPLFALSALLLARTVTSLRAPSPGELTLPESRRILDELVAGGVRDRAMELAEKLLARKDATTEDRAAIRLQRARLRAGIQIGEGPKATAVVGRMVEDFQFAGEHGQTLTASDLQSLGRGLERQKKYGEAVETYDAALVAGVESPSELRRHVIELRRGALRASADEIREALSGFLADLPDDRLDLRNWALLGLLDVLGELGRLPEATGLLETNREKFVGSDFASRFEYLEALLLYKQGARDEAERRLRALHEHAERIADEQNLHAGAVHDRRACRVVARNHRDALFFAIQLLKGRQRETSGLRLLRGVLSSVLISAVGGLIGGRARVHGNGDVITPETEDR